MRKINLKRVLLTVLLIIGIPVVLFAGWIVWSINDGHPPQFFPLNNQQAQYTIIKSATAAQGTEDTYYELSNPSLQEERYFVEYRDENVFTDDLNRNFFRIMVGNSKVDLEPLIGKDILITKGKFVSSYEQCIVQKCTSINGPWAVLNIDNLEVR